MAVPRFALAGLVVVLLLAGPSRGDEPAVPATEAAPAEKAELSPELQQLAQQLDDDEFATRQAATEQLAKLGIEAIPALEQAIESDSVEASTRAFEVLERLFAKGDDRAKAAARKSLEQMAESGTASARRAKHMLESAERDANVPGADAIEFGPRGIGGRIRIGGFGGGFAPIPVAAAAAKSTRISVINGVKTVEVEEAGRKVKVVEDPEKGIEMEVTTKKDGKETTEKFAAKSVEELKEKHPEAHKIYEEQAKAGAIRIEIGGARGAFPAPFPVPLPGAFPAPAPRVELKEALEESIKRLEEQIEKTKGDANLPEEFRKRHVETIQRHIERLKESLEKREIPKKAEKTEKIEPAERD
jgi:hypothetical protein